MKRNRPRTCNGKRRYRDKADALRTVRGIALDSTREKIPVRAYECPVCNGWHISSKPDRGMRHAA